MNDLGQVRRKMPSATVLRLHEFTLDVALLLAERWTSFANRGAVVKYMLADSSPVAGFDWLWSMHYEIKKEDLIELFESVVRLSLATSQFCETLRDEAAEDGHGLPVEPRMTPLPEWKPWLSCIKRCIREASRTGEARRPEGEKGGRDKANSRGPAHGRWQMC